MQVLNFSNAPVSGAFFATNPLAWVVPLVNLQDSHACTDSTLCLSLRLGKTELQKVADYTSLKTTRLAQTSCILAVFNNLCHAFTCTSKSFTF